MANSLYTKARERFARGQFDWLTDTFKCLLVDTGVYSVNLDGHEFLSDIGTSARVATSGPLTGKALVSGAIDCNDVVFSGVTGASVEAVVLFKDTGVPETSPLVAYFDTGTGLPITPNSGDINLAWDNGPNRVIKL